jgi:hypothetical protein
MSDEEPSERSAPDSTEDATDWEPATASMADGGHGDTASVTGTADEGGPGDPAEADTRHDAGADWAVLLPTGAIVGVVGFALGYLLTYTLASGPIRNSALGAVAADDVWRVVGWVYFNAHFVDTVGAVSVLGVEVGGAINFVGRVDALPTLLFAVPPLVLVAAGGLLGYRLAGSASVLAGARAGVALPPGYLVPRPRDRHLPRGHRLPAGVRRRRRGRRERRRGVLTTPGTAPSSPGRCGRSPPGHRR